MRRVAVARTSRPRIKMGRVALVILVALFVAAAWLTHALYTPYQGFPPRGVYVDIPRGASGRTIARLLAGGGVVRSRLAFEVLCRWRTGRVLQAGEYFFNRPANAFDVYQTIAEGRVFQLEFTVPEGFTMFDIADLLAREGLVSREAFLEAARDSGPIRDLAPHPPSLEGFLFPATYQFPRHPTPQDVVGAMVRRFRETWQALPGANAERNGLSADAVVALASMVERETSVPEERPLVAAVFANRLRLGLRLQCDPTVIYALQLENRYSGSLGSKDLHLDSLYNTYRHRGLPPGPIANPGEAALRAALSPAPVDYLYFVADGRGGHVFSKTLAEHNQNVARYRHLIAQGAREQEGDSRLSDIPGRRPAAKRSP